MRVEPLSTYAADQLSESRRAHHAAQSSQAEAEIAAMEAAARAEHARSSKPLWRRALRVASAEERAAQADQQAAGQRAAVAASQTELTTIRVSQRSKGERGEQALLAALAGALSDDWMAFTGYQTKRGEADLVLVGPDGVWVVEVKNRRVRLYVAGPDRWYVDKLSSSGRAQGQAEAHDAGGRVWGRQASEAAGALWRWLDRQGHAVPVRTAVVLMDDMAEVVLHGESGVDLVTARVPDLLVTIQVRSTPLAAAQCRAIESLIRRDHEHTMRKRAERAERADRAERGDRAERRG
ncbi:MAG: nuclease-related domain-containing protein [Acidimicrobiales bacterium]